MNDGCLLSQAEQEKPNTMLISWKEMDTYQKAMAKMANDILSLRNKVSTLETENNNLRHQVSTQERMGNTSEEEEEIIGNMKQKLSQSSTEMRRLKDRVQQLQNELIRKNDREKDLLLMQQSHHQQQQNLRRYQDKLQKMKSLEQTVKNQEKVIQTMEKILEDKLNRSSKEREREREISETASPMGRPLGKHSSEVNKQISIRSPTLAESQFASNVQWNHQRVVPLWSEARFLLCLQDFLSGTSDKLNLMAKLESAQNRIRTLESELEDSARRWGQEKQDLKSRLMEKDNGFSPSSTEVPMRNQNSREWK
ncbi:coiled-coil domain-containing protein 33-like isoform X3 [Monodelphis domestica]|uniref:coiled-coil domain-containing protein 33-like isoform X3 n=1 Tax=Monodelphis domestica TaxID=13616 RepID=UPI0024E25CC8|nr:coiled-coil domain-containing protein 33-like isoform X3 [Monodelphis domestica]